MHAQAAGTTAAVALEDVEAQAAELEADTARPDG